MKKTINFLLGLFFVFTSSCSESELDSPNINRDTLYAISVLHDSVILTTGSVGIIDFTISPYNKSFDFSNDESNFAIGIMSGHNFESENYKLTKIEQIGDICDTTRIGKFRAYIEDNCLKNNYDDNVKIVLANKNKGIFFKSSSFTIKYKCDSLTKAVLETGLPLVIIKTINQEEPTCDYVSPPPGSWGAGITNTTKVPGRIVMMKDSLVLYNSGEYEKDKSGITIRIRGNTSAYGNKKPYKIKLQKKADLLLRGDDKKFKDKNWLLLEDGNLNKKIGFKLNELMNLQWTPSYQYVNVLFNGDYKGLYMLVESVNRNEDCRLNVDKTGFIFEYDAYWWNENVYVKSSTLPWPMHYTFKYPDPDDITEEEIQYFTSMIAVVEKSLNDGTYPDYIDVNSFAAWMLAHDILGNGDGGGSNYYLTKKDNTAESKVMMANLWDFDHIFRNKNNWDSAHGMFYFSKLFNSENKDFINLYKTKWREISPILINEMTTYLNNYLESKESISLDKSIQMDNERWERSNVAVSERFGVAKEWFNSRHIWLSTAIENL